MLKFICYVKYAYHSSFYMKNIIIPALFCIFLIFIIPLNPVWSIYDPLTVPNNKYGIHIIDENDLENAAALVNSSGGDWGYVTLVITEQDRSSDKWTGIFDTMKNYHLIPLIR